MQLVYSNLQYEISRFHKAEPKDNTNTTDLPGLVVIADLMQPLLLLLVVPTLLRQTSAKHRVPVLSKAVCFYGSAAHHVDLLKEPLQLRLRRLHRFHRLHCHQVLLLL